MPTPVLGTHLSNLCDGAERELLLVAPFIKLEALQRVLCGLSDDLAVTCVTRWRPNEIALGVSDLEIWNLFRDHPNRKLYLRHDLHAKFYRADEQCLVGSANLTLTALGWTQTPNYELLVESGQTEQLIAFEEQLFASVVEADDDLYRQMKTAVEMLPQIKAPVIAKDADETAIDLACWLPTLRTPEKLFIAYQGRTDELTNSAKHTTTWDLRAFDIPIGLSKPQFESYIATVLLQMPMINRVDKFVEQPRRFGEVKSLLKTSACYQGNPEFDAIGAWQTLMRWLLHFLPDRYDLSVPRHSEIFSRKG